jgi:hypothetical protein
MAMKTDQMMLVCLPLGDLHIRHKSGMGSLTDLFKMGNQYRINNGKTPGHITQFLESKATQEFKQIVAERQNIPVDQVVRKTGRGSAARTEAQLHFLIYAAEYLSPELHYDVIDAFIHSKILEYRDQSGDSFKALNYVLTASPLLADATVEYKRAIYIRLAKAIRSRIAPPNDNWNEATADQLRERGRMEDRLIDLIELGVVRDCEHLLELVRRLQVSPSIHSTCNNPPVVI